MSEQDYASKDLKRRPFRTTIILLSLVSVIAATTFLFLFSSILLDVTSSLTSTGIASVLGVFYETFMLATVLLVFILGITVVSSNISLEMVSRRKDIGLMKSIGTLTDTIFDHFMAQAVILILTGIVLGIAIGIVLYFVGLIWLAFSITGIEFIFNFPWIQITVLAIILLIVGYFAAQKPIYDAVNESPSSSLNPDVGMRIQRFGYLDSFGLPFRIASKSTGRRIKGTRRTLLTLFLSFALASTLWIGGGIVESTMDGYVIRSMGYNVVAIGHPTMLEDYYEAYSLTGERLNDSFRYLDSEYMIPNTLIEELAGVSGIDTVESRLVDYTTVSEGAAIIWNPTLEQYERIGGDRADSAAVVGIDFELTFSDWYYDGSDVNDSRSAWIGGKMANDLYIDPLIQSVGVRGTNFEIRGIAFEVLNAGMITMLPLKAMQDLYEIDGVNLVLVQLDSYSESVISAIEELAENYGFGIYRQQSLLEYNLSIISAYWNLIQPIPIMALISAFLSLMYYLLISVFGRFRDYVIMRSIGAKPIFIAKTMVAEGLDIGLKAGIPAVLFSVVFSVYFLVPEASVLSLLYLPLSIISILGILVLVLVLSAIPVYMIFASRSDLRVSEFAV